MSSTWPNRVLLGICGLVTALSLLLILTFDYGRDQGIYAVVARTILDGGMPYRDAWDFKPPGIFLIFAVARSLFGSAQIGIRVLEVIGLVAMGGGMIRLADRLWREPRIGIVAATLAILVHAQLDLWHTAQPESFGGMVTIGGLLCGLAERRKVAAWICAGAMFGFAGLLKPPLIAGAAVMAVMLAARARRAESNSGHGLRAAAVPVLAISGGVVAVVGGCAAWFAARGALGDLYDALFVFTPNYTKLGWEQPAPLLLLRGIQDWLFTYSSLLTAGLLVLTFEHPTAEERSGVRLLLAVIAFHVIGVAMQGKFFAYHWGATWPLTALLAALGFWKVWAKVRDRGAVAVACFIAAAIAIGTLRTASGRLSFAERTFERISLATSGDRDAWDVLASINDVDAAENRRVATWLHDHVSAGQPIFVWGFEPIIYDLADRPAASRYIYNVPQRVHWDTARARDVLLRELRSRPPAAIVIEHGDVFRYVTGNELDSASALESFPELHSFIVERYERATTIFTFEIYRARSQ